MDHKHFIGCKKYIAIKQSQQDLNLAFYFLKRFESIHLIFVSTLVLNMMTSQLINTCHYRSSDFITVLTLCVGKENGALGTNFIRFGRLCYRHSYPLLVSSIGLSCQVQPSRNNYTPHKIARRLHFPPDTTALHLTLASK